MICTDRQTYKMITGQYEVFKTRFVLTDLHYQPKLFQANPHCYCYCVVIVCGGGGYGDGGVAAQEYADDDVVFL